ncbi:MAG: tRNA pseudouridine(55) synthase TruB [Alistipes sp.]|nr:tRNA pseudouridine(55) synthase TruB [Candidatus Minthomonas equi]
MTPEFPILDKTHVTPLERDIEKYRSGFLLVFNKPYRWTSADVVRKVKFTLKRHFHGELKVGHAGTLDPLATGILILCAGRATKSAEVIQAGRKEYIAEITFGATTPSFDLEKEIDATYPYEHITPESVENVLKSFIGPQEQYPPVFSAKYVDGMRAYERARSGEEIELKPSSIEIYDIALMKFDLPRITLRVQCSKGTYIRALARDLGLALESGAHLTSLTRTGSGDFKLEDCMEMDDFIRIYSDK